jgi:hypothetical protein
MLSSRLSEPQSQSGHFRYKKNILTLLGFEPWTIQPAA